MASFSIGLFEALSFFVSGILAYIVYYTRVKVQPKYPPGPKGYPIIGSLYQIDTERPWLTYNPWMKEHGPLTMFWVLGKPVLLIGSMKVAMDLVQRRANIYSDRPRLVMAAEVVSKRGMYPSIAKKADGTPRKQRKILNERLRANALKDWAAPVERKEIPLFLQRLVQNPYDFIPVLKLLTSTVMLNTTYSHHSVSDLNDPIVKRVNEATDRQFGAQIQGRFLVDRIPLLKHIPAWFPGAEWKRTGILWHKETMELNEELFKSVEDKLATEGHVDPCFVSRILENDMDKLTREEAAVIAGAVIDGGTDTLTGTLMIIVIIFLYHPHILKAAQKHVDEVVGRDRLPTFDDSPHLPYLMAVIRESFRWRTVAPIGNAHELEVDDVYEGYFIPKGTTIYPCSQMIHEDPELYPEPEIYRPERFLDSEGKLNNLPHAGFGFGNRKCVGMHFAEYSLLQILANFVWAFDVVPIKDESGKPVMPSLDPRDWGSFLASPPPYFDCKIVPRTDSVPSIISTTVSNL